MRKFAPWDPISTKWAVQTIRFPSLTRTCKTGFFGKTRCVRGPNNAKPKRYSIFRLTGIAFNVHGRQEAEERMIPFDLVPRIISNAEWQKPSRGVEQRIRAIDAFLHDIYRRQEIIRAGLLPKEMVVCNDAFLPQMIGIGPPGGIYTHIVEIVPVRTGEDRFFVLEDRRQYPHTVRCRLHA